MSGQIDLSSVKQKVLKLIGKENLVGVGIGKDVIQVYLTREQFQNLSPKLTMVDNVEIIYHVAGIPVAFESGE